MYFIISLPWGYTSDRQKDKQNSSQLTQLPSPHFWQPTQNQVVVIKLWVYIYTYTSKTTRKKYYELISLRFINFWTVIQKVVEAIKSWCFGCYLSFHPMFSFHPTIPPTHCTNIYVHTHLEKEAQLPEHPAFCGWMFGGHPLQQVILGRLTFLMLGYVSMGHWIFISSGIPLLILLQIRVTKVNSELPPVVTQCSVNCSASSGKGVTSAWKPRNAAYHIFICPAHMCCRT